MEGLWRTLGDLFWLRDSKIGNKEMTEKQDYIFIEIDIP